MAPGDESTLHQLHDLACRPAEPYEPLDPDLRQWSPNSVVDLPRTALFANLRRAKHGVAPGRSGYTSEIVRLVLDVDAAVESLGTVAARLANAQVPTPIAAALRLGPSCGRAPLRRAASEASSSATSFAVLLLKLWPNNLLPAFDQATRPHQYVLATRAGTEALAHSLQRECDLDPALLVLSVDGIGAYDLISRGAMLQALRNTPDAAAILPVVTLFYGQPSAFLWQDDAGPVHRIVQAKGGEQGDPLMPVLFALGVAGL